MLVDGWWVTPTTVKAVVRHGDSVLLGLNPRQEWELPGGRPEQGEPTIAHTLERELLEETGLSVTSGRLLLADLFEVVAGHRLLVVVRLVDLIAGHPGVEPPVVQGSSEHGALAWFRYDQLPEPLPEIYGRAIAAAWSPE